MIKIIQHKDSSYIEIKLSRQFNLTIDTKSGRVKA